MTRRNSVTHLDSSRIQYSSGAAEKSFRAKDVEFAVNVNTNMPFAIAFFNIWANGLQHQEMMAFADLEEAFVVAAEGQKVPYYVFEMMAGLDFRNSYLPSPEDAAFITSFDINTFELWLRQKGFGLQYRGHIGYNDKAYNRDAFAKARRLAAGESIQSLTTWGLTLRIDKSSSGTRCYLYWGFQMEDTEFLLFLYENPHLVVMVGGHRADTVIREFEARLLEKRDDWDYITKLLAQLSITTALQQYIWKDTRKPDQLEYIVQQLGRAA